MKKFQSFFNRFVIAFLCCIPFASNAQIVISQYYEGGGTNKWIELTNLGNTAVNTASPQLKLGLWSVTGSTGNISFTGAASNTYNLTVTIPAKGSVLIGNTANGTEVPYLTAASANETSNSVINFNGNDGVALLDATNTIIDKFGEGINAADISYVRSTGITAPNANYTSSEWTNTALTAVQTAAASTPPRLGYQLAPLCSAPAAQPTALSFSGVTSSSINGSFTVATADGYVAVQSTSSSLSASPVDGTSYAAGNALGGGTVVSSGTATSFNSSGLSSNTIYYYFMFAYNNTGCSGGPKYLATAPLSSSQATPYPPCIAPSAQPTALSFSGVTSSSMNGSFTAAAAAGYVVVQSTGSSLSAGPVDGTNYSSGNTLGGGIVVSSGASALFSASGLSSNTTYYFFVFSYNNTNCTGGPKYLTSGPLSASQATPYPACVTPSAQPTAISFSAVTSSSMNGSFTSAQGAGGYLVVQSTSNSLSASPVDGTNYSAGNILGGGTVISNSSSASFSTAGLNSNTTYYFFVFSYNNTSCIGGPKYLTASPLGGSQITPYPPCAAPASSATAMLFSSVTSTSMTVSFTAASSVDGYLVVRSTGSSLSASPANGTTYVAGNTFGGGTVVGAGTATSVNQASLASSTTYYFYVFTYNNVNCTSGPVYKTAALTGSKATDPAALSYYFGNLHSHSSYSDGNSDNTAKIPSDDYAFAKNAMCLDFLGVSEHNHAGAGMQLASWAPGITQAAAATTSTFIALHGQEWGVIGIQGTAGDHAGHVIVYGLDSLAGWETGNYQIYVPKSTYLGTGGLFDIINRHGNNAFASLAHPDNYDFNNILNSTYDVKADDAIVGTAIESGPAFSVDTTYTNPAAIGYFAFYKNMLAKGYHLGPTIDHDNHNLTFGKTAKTRLAIMATSLSEANILDAMRKMRFYATEDCNARISFTINTNYPMGSIITKAGSPVIAVTTITTNAVTSIKLMYGVPGSGSSPTTLTSTTSSSLNYTHTALANLATGYYFIDITESNGNRVITAPIWYTRDDAALRPLFVTSFFTMNEAGRVVLKWTASDEPADEQYEIQRSVDGRNFISIGKVAGKGHNISLATYAIEDVSPVNGLAYYRLVQKNANGNIAYSELKPVNRSGIVVDYLLAYPNPVANTLTVKIASLKTEKTRIDIADMTGRVVKTMPVLINNGEQNLQLNVSGLVKGSYMLSIQLGQKVKTQILNKL